MTNSKGSPVVVGGATSAEQVVQNAAADSITLSTADRAEIEVSAPGPVHVRNSRCHLRVSAPEYKLSSYQDAECSCGQNRVDAISILTFAPTGSVSV